MTRSYKYLPLFSGVLAGFALSGAVQAQEAGSEEVFTLEEIVVTAERREQNLQDIPISATVLTAESMAKKGVGNIHDIQNVAPSVAINTYNRSTFINIRGVGIAQSAPTSVPGVAYYTDGILVPHEQFISQSFFDIATIEVLRGPQGTLTGQNSTGGAVYVRTPAPEYGETFGYVDGTVGNYDKYRLVGALNVGLSENFAVRVAYVHDERDSFTKNIGPSPSSPGDMNLDAARINFAMRSADDKLRVNLRGEHFDLHTGYNAVKNPDDAVSDDPFVIQEDAISYLDQNGYRISGEVKYAITDGIDMRGLVSYQDGYTRDQVDGDRTATALPVPEGLPATSSNRRTYPARVSRGDTTFETFMAEFNLMSTDDSPLQWVVGGFYFDEDVPVELYRDNHSNVDFVSSDSTIDTEAENTSKSLFGQLNWYATEEIELIAGARYSWDEQVYHRNVLPGPPMDPFSTSTDSTELTGKIGINYHMDDTMLYITASKGYKAGGVNLLEPQGNFGAEKNFVYEAGVKTELMDRHIRINADVFYSDYQDIQLASLLNGLPVTQNAASGEAWGMELEMLAQFGGLSFNLGLSYLSAEFAEDACINDANSNAVSPECDNTNRLVHEGDTLPFSPEWTVNAGVEYEFVLDNGMSLTPRVQWSHLDSQLATPFPGTRSFVPSRDIFNFRLTLDVNEDLRVEGFVDNFTDETYIASQVQDASSANGGYLYGPPRTFGLRTKYNF
ncbi:TonB-dependent receptor [Emcibacter sp.]|uniref:TonB-dependent receptor n=1 Tax=Emcibacter sp. TaxID=1979954 RepID=UPI003A92E042